LGAFFSSARLSSSRGLPNIARDTGICEVVVPRIERLRKVSLSVSQLQTLLKSQ
jgi:hypothetical protein